MDTSKEYIEMCGKSKEIQKYYLDNTDLIKSINSFCDIDLFARINGGTVCKSCGNEEYSSGPFCPACGTKLTEKEYFTIERFREDNLHIWLPRQDQLQEMLHHKQWHNYMFHKLFIEFFVELNDHEERSREQLWFMFVMKTNYNKTWRNREWQKEPE